MPEAVVRPTLTRNQVLAKFVVFSVALLVVPILVTLYLVRGVEHFLGRQLALDQRERPAVNGGLGVLTAMGITVLYIISALREPPATVEVKPLVKDFVRQLNAGKVADLKTAGEKQE